MEIERYSFGRMTIAGETYRADLIVLPDRLITDWRRIRGHSLAPEDLEEVFAANPQCLVIGTGALGAMKVPPETLAAIEARGIQVIVHRTLRAVKSFNGVRTKLRTAAAFHLTC